MLSDLMQSSGYIKPAKRLGRGNSSGKGTYCGKGIKGQKARAGKGSHIPAHFEGGQTPLHRRLPKLRGFKRYFKLSSDVQVVNLGMIQNRISTSEKNITKELLQKQGIIRSELLPVKILGSGEYSSSFSFSGIETFSETARQKIILLGGSIA